MNNDLMRIRLSDILHAVIKRRIMIGILTAAGLVIGILLSVVSYMRGEMVKEYAITSSFAVTSVNEDGLFTSRTSNPTSSDITLAEKMVDSVIYVIKSDRTLNAAISKLNLVGISNREISRNLTLKQYNETQIVEMTLYWRSAEEGIQIVNAINQVSPEILIQTLKIGGLSVVNGPTSRYLVGGSLNASMWIYMAILGFIIGCGLSVLNVLLKPTLINAKDVESTFDLDVIAILPDDKQFFSRKHLAAMPMDEEGENAGGDNVVSEEFGSAAHILRNRLRNVKPQCVYITSATANEGKTTIAANLALQLADLEQKVLLIDFDIRNPSLGSLFVDKVDYYHSLNALYRGETSQEDAITHVTGFLDLLPSILERTSLPLDEAMMAMISSMMADYDYVLMDTAPVGQSADTMNLNRIAQAAIFVIRYDTATIPEIQEALDRLEKSGTTIIGAFVNGVRKANTNSPFKNPFDRKWPLFDRGKGRESIDNLNEIVSQQKEEETAAPAAQPPVQAPPVEAPPAEAPPVEEQPVEEQPTEEQPAEEQPETPTFTDEDLKMLQSAFGTVYEEAAPEEEEPYAAPDSADGGAPLSGQEQPKAIETEEQEQSGQEQEDENADEFDPFLMLAKSLGQKNSDTDRKE